MQNVNPIQKYREQYHESHCTYYHTTLTTYCFLQSLLLEYFEVSSIIYYYYYLSIIVLSIIFQYLSIKDIYFFKKYNHKPLSCQLILGYAEYLSTSIIEKLCSYTLHFHLRFQGCMYHTDKSFFPKAQNFVYTMADRYFKS